MIIFWFLKNAEEGTENALFETNGELPREGGIVYLKDIRPNGEHGTGGGKYKVAHSYHKVFLSNIPFERLDPENSNAGKDPMDIYESLASEVERRGMYPFAFKMNRSFDVSRHEGEVIVEKIPNV